MRLLPPALAAALLIGATIGGCGAPPEEPKPAALAPAQMTPGQKLLKARLAELDSIQKQPSFKESGFSPDGPFAGWIDGLKDDARRPEIKSDKTTRQGLETLEKLAFEYVYWISFDVAKKCGQIFSLDIGESCHIKKSIEDKTTEIKQIINRPMLGA